MKGENIMLIAEKQRFIKNIETNMRNILTIEEMEKLVGVLNEELGMYCLWQRCKRKSCIH